MKKLFHNMNIAPHSVILIAAAFAVFGVRSLRAQTAVNQNPPVVDRDQLSVTYKNVRGDTLTATWNPPKYDVPEGERVLVRPNITVNGAVVPIDTTYPVLKSPCVELVDRVLRLQTPAGQLEVDWRGKVPEFSNQ